MTEDYISLGECAEKLGVDKSYLRKAIKSGRYGQIEPIFRRNREKGNQKELAILNLDYESIKKWRNTEGFEFNKKIEKNSTKGFFYIIQTNPHHIPNRYKFGFTNDLQNRISSYKSICPNLKVVEKFPCDMIHEQPLLRMVSRYGKRIGQEAYEIDEINTIINEIKEVLGKLIGGQ